MIGDHSWDRENTDEVITGIAIGVGVMLLTKLVELAIERLREASVERPVDE